MQPLIYDLYVMMLKGEGKRAREKAFWIDTERLADYEIVWYNTIMDGIDD